MTVSEKKVVEVGSEVSAVQKPNSWEYSARLEVGTGPKDNTLDRTPRGMEAIQLNIM